MTFLLSVSLFCVDLLIHSCNQKCKKQTIVVTDTRTLFSSSTDWKGEGSTNSKTDCYTITEILLKVVLNTNNFDPNHRCSDLFCCFSKWSTIESDCRTICIRMVHCFGRKQGLCWHNYTDTDHCLLQTIKMVVTRSCDLISYCNFILDIDVLVYFSVSSVTSAIFSI